MADKLNITRRDFLGCSRSCCERADRDWLTIGGTSGPHPRSGHGWRYERAPARDRALGSPRT